MINFTCPACGEEFEGPESLAGAKVECPCGTKFYVPENIAPVEPVNDEVPVQEAPQTPTPSQYRRKPAKQQRSFALPVTIMIFLLIGGAFYYLQKQSPQREKTEEMPSEEAQLEVPAPIALESDSAASPSGVNHFDFIKWKTTYGKKIEDMKEWEKRNPKPYRSYFPNNNLDGMKRWYINLGPLGLRTYMHDKTWAAASAVKQLYPKMLCDEKGLLFNNFEVLEVKSGSPSEGHVKKGDLILKIDDVPLKTATALQLPQPLDRLPCRGLEFHAGQLIDAAEGRGRIKLTVLRPPAGFRDKSINSPAREWKTLKSQELAQAFRFSVPMPSGDIGRISFLSRKKERLKDKYLAKSPIPFNVKLSNSSGKSIAISKTQGKFNIPEGEWTLSGTIKASHAHDQRKYCQIETISAPVMPQSLREYIQEIEFDIPQLGSFGSVYNPNGAKAANVSAVMVHRLVAQQVPNGSWPKARSYTSIAFHTSMCGLALMSTGNPEYNERIKKAAHYVAYEEDFRKWAYSRGTRLIFLAEYYLRTRDESILPGLKQHVIAARACVFSDYTSGHSVGGPGYGGHGYVGSSSVIACGLALADECGVLTEPQGIVLDRMLMRVQQLAPGGTVPYGRGGKHNTEVNEGHGCGCRTGAFVPACLVSGGARLFLKAAIERYSTPPYGTAENGHATQTLHFFWSSIAIANCGPEPHRNNMSAYIWKFNTYREYDGFANKNNARTEYHGGDGVIGSPHWRTAGYVILLNAHKRNLAITGDPAYKSPALQDNPLAFFGDKAFHNHVLRNWNLAEAVLGGAAPRAFSSTLNKIRNLPDTEELGAQLFELLNKEVPAVVKSINFVPDLKKSDKVRLLQLVHGIIFESACTVDGPATEDDEISARNLDKKEAKAAAKKFKKDLAEEKIKSRLKYSVDIKPISLANRWRSRCFKGREARALFPALEAKGTVTCIDPSRKYLKAPVEFDFSTQGPPANASKREKKKFEAEQIKSFKIEMDPGEKGDLTLEFDYAINGVPLSYTEKLSLPTPVTRAWLPNHCKVWVPGIVAEDYDGKQYCIRILLQTGEIIAAEERVLDAPIPENHLLAGTKAWFLISPGSTWGHNLHAVKILNPKVRLAKPIETSIIGSKFTGTPDSLVDCNSEKGIAVNGKNPEFTVEQVFAEAVTVDSYFMNASFTKWKRARYDCCLEAWQNGKWQKIARFSPNRNGKKLDIFKKFVAVTSDRFRFKIKTKRMKGLKLNQLRLHTALPLGDEMKLMRKSTW